MTFFADIYITYKLINGISNVMAHYCDIQLKLMITFYITTPKWDVDTRYLCKWKTNLVSKMDQAK